MIHMAWVKPVHSLAYIITFGWPISDCYNSFANNTCEIEINLPEGKMTVYYTNSKGNNVHDGSFRLMLFMERPEILLISNI